MEELWFWQNIAMGVGPFFAYFFGILVRKIVWPGTNSPPLVHQILLGVPMSLVVVSPLLPVLVATRSQLSGFLVTLGVIMEHGMVVNETATYRLKQLAKQKP
jgi:hypothetical protein